MKKRKKYKIVGKLNGAWKNPEGKLIEIECVKYARLNVTFLLKLFYMRFFYDYVDVEVEE